MWFASIKAETETKRNDSVDCLVFFVLDIFVLSSLTACTTMLQLKLEEFKQKKMFVKAPQAPDFKKMKWWDGTELNRRHEDFQFSGLWLSCYF